MAELLIKAKSHWMDSLKQADIDAMPKQKKDQFDARSQIGDIIVVKPDGWEWGREECLPRFIVVKLPGVLVGDVKHMEKPIIEIVEEDVDIIVRKTDWDNPIKRVEFMGRGEKVFQEMVGEDPNDSSNYKIKVKMKRRKMWKKRKHTVKENWVKSYSDSEINVVEIPEEDKLNFINTTVKVKDKYGGSTP